MLDRRGKDECAYISRKPNEKQDVWPRTAGAEYSMMVRPDSRLARYSWVTALCTCLETCYWSCPKRQAASFEGMN